MNLSEYQPLAFRTAKPLASLSHDLEHAALGLSTEVGEFATNVKRHIIYGRAIDDAMRTNMIEELGDYCWYLALAATACKVDLGAIEYDMKTEADTGILTPLSQAVMLMISASCGMWLEVVETERHGPQEVLTYGLMGVQKACDELAVDLSEVLTKNIEKLRERFPRMYSDELAEARLDKGGLPATES